MKHLFFVMFNPLKSYKILKIYIKMLVFFEMITYSWPKCRNTSYFFYFLLRINGGMFECLSENLWASRCQTLWRRNCYFNSANFIFSLKPCRKCKLKKFFKKNNNNVASCTLNLITVGIYSKNAFLYTK